MSEEWIMRGVAVLLFDGRESRHGQGHGYGKDGKKESCWTTRVGSRLSDIRKAYQTNF